MAFKKTLTVAATAATLLIAGATGAMAQDRDHDGHPAGSWAERHDSRADYNRNHSYQDRDHDGRPAGSYAERHDSRSDYNRSHSSYRVVVGHDRVYSTVRAHRYRYIGAPYWYRGYYGVRAYDPYGKVVFVRVDPYSANWLGVAFRF